MFFDAALDQIRSERDVLPHGGHFCLLIFGRAILVFSDFVFKHTRAIKKKKKLAPRHRQHFSLAGFGRPEAQPPRSQLARGPGKENNPESPIGIPSFEIKLRYFMEKHLP